MSINKENTLKFDKVALKQLPIVDRLSFFFGKILTSTLLIIIVMVTFLVGVAVHLADVFDSWFIAIGMQAVILIASTNSDILPTIKVGKDKTLTLIPFVMSFLMAWYLFISYKGITFDSNTVEFWTAMSKAVGLATTEFMFSYLFTFRFNKFMKDLNSLKEAPEPEKPDGRQIIREVMDEYKKPIEFKDGIDITLTPPVDGTPNIMDFKETPEPQPTELFPDEPKINVVPKPTKVKAREGAGRIL